MKKSTKIVIIAISIFFVVALLAICIINQRDLNVVTKNFLEYMNLIVTPVCLVVGIIIGYPLIKRKLASDYISRQFEIMHEANRALRKECLLLMNKYPSKYVSSRLRKEDISECLLDIEKLTQIAFDANPDAHRYSMLVEKSLNEFNERYPEKGIVSYFKETLHNYVHFHINLIYDYAKSLGTSFDANIVNKKRLNKNLEKFVHDNKYTDIESVDCSIDYYHTSQLLVFFFSTSLSVVPRSNLLYHFADYKVAPSPSPFVRLLFDDKIYIPPIIKSSNPLFVSFANKLDLIGYTSMRFVDSKTGVKDYHTFYYANISACGFVKGTITDKSLLEEFFDIYLDGGSLKDYRISNFEICNDAEIVTFEVETELLNKKFIDKKRLIIDKMKKEVRPSN